MKTLFSQVYERVNNHSLLELELPEDKNFIQKTKEFQDGVKNLDQMLDINEKHIKTVYFLCSEMIQAVVHNGKFEPAKFVNRLKLACLDNRIYILSQNLIDNERINHVKIKFEEVNSAFDGDNSQEELALRYKFKMKNMPYSRAGISVGVLDLARRSMNKLLYDFKEIDNQHSVFSIICMIDI
jgi:hypothetical protein